MWFCVVAPESFANNSSGCKVVTLCKVLCCTPLLIGSEKPLMGINAILRSRLLLPKLNFHYVHIQLMGQHHYQ